MIYGRPFDREAQINRTLRRGLSGLLSGRSEAAAPVVTPIRRGRGPSVSAVPGPGGAPGQPRVDPFKHGRHLLGTVGVGAGITFGFSNTISRGTSTVGPSGGDPADLQGDPYTKFTSSAVANNVGSFMLDQPQVQVGQGNGRGGYLLVAQFAFSSLPATRWWFAGSTQTEIGNLSTASTNLVGVGQLAGYTTPFFIHNDGTGTTTRVASGFPNMSTNRVHEIRVFADPRSTVFTVVLESFVNRVSAGSVTYTATSNIPSVMIAPFQVVAGNGSGGGVAAAVFRSAYLAIQPTPDVGIDA